jgi:hypothetical protein
MSVSTLARSARSLGHDPGDPGSPAIRGRQAPRRWQDLALLVPLLLAALAMRLVNLGAYSGLFDEGIRAEQLFLMRQGFRPFRDIFAAQGPLLLDSLYPLYRLFDWLVDPALVAVRLVPVAFSLVGLAGLFWLGVQLAGRLGGFLAGLVLLGSPLYLEGSRLALAEVPALAPAILALGAALRYQARGDRRWLWLAGLLLTLSLLMKPITAAAAVGVGVAALLRGWRGLRDLLLVGLAMLALSALVIYLLGFGGVADQLWDYRRAASAQEGFSLRKNLAAVEAGLQLEPAALLLLAALGGVTLLLVDARQALPLILWALAGLGLLLTYSPLHGKHIVVAIPGLALLAGAGLAALRRALVPLLPLARHRLAWLPVALGLGLYLLTLLPILPRSGQLLQVTADTDVDPAFDQYSDATAVIQALVGPSDFLVTDQPYLAFLAERMVPPQLVDTALTRIRSRSLTGQRAIDQAAPYDPRVVVLWGDRLRSLPAFKSWVDQRFQVVKVYNRRGDSDRAVYLRRDQDFQGARARLAAAAAGGQSASFGPLRLVGARLEREEVDRGQGASLALHWELQQPTSVDYHVRIDLRDASGRSLDDQEESLSGGAEGTNLWPVGRWLLQSSFVRADVLPGHYTVTVSLYDSRARASVPLDNQPGSSALTVGRLQVR